MKIRILRVVNTHGGVVSFEDRFGRSNTFCPIENVPGPRPQAADVYSACILSDGEIAGLERRRL